jgi:hypothetical protein
MTDILNKTIVLVLNRNWQATHAHIDHCGLLPRLVAKGFKGPIYCTEASAEVESGVWWCTSWTSWVLADALGPDPG